MLYYLWTSLREPLEDLRVAWVLMILDQLTFRALAAALLAFFTVVLAGPRTIRWLRMKKIGDAGLTDADALRMKAASKANTPTMGGILICGAIVTSTALLADIRNFYVLLGLVVALWLAVLGGFDDWLKLTAASRPGGSRQGLRAWEKLVFQLGLGVMVGWFVFRAGNASEGPDMAHALTLPFQAAYEKQGDATFLSRIDSMLVLPAGVFVLLATLMIAGWSNAVNISDGMDGLAGGTSAIVALGLVALTYIAGTEAVAQHLLVPAVPESGELLILAAATAGACLGFLWWNCSPAQVFMGDTGSLCLGGVLAYLAVVIRQEILLFVMSGVFLLEIGSVMLQVGWFKHTKRRTGVGQRLFKVAPIHHHFHILGWTEQQVVVRFWIVTSVLVVLALALIKVR